VELRWDESTTKSRKIMEVRSISKRVEGKSCERSYPSFISLKIVNVMLFLLVIIFPSCRKGNTDFYNKVLSNYNSDSYFIAIDVKSPGFNGRTVIKNSNLFQFINKTRGDNKAEYQSLMSKMLSNRRVLKISGYDLIKWNFTKVNETPDVIFNANKGADEFVRHYFNGSALNYGVTAEDMYAIINQLFYWQIPTRIDKDTGVLLIGD
jgi:hypothetical protein